MLDPGLVMTGTKCGHNHVSSFLQPHSASGLQRAVIEVGVWTEDAWVQIPASPTSLALWLAFFIEHIIKSKTHCIELLYGLNEIIPCKLFRRIGYYISFVLIINCHMNYEMV